MSEAATAPERNDGSCSPLRGAAPAASPRHIDPIASPVSSSLPPPLLSFPLPPPFAGEAPDASVTISVKSISESGEACLIDEYGFYVTEDTQTVATDAAPIRETESLQREAHWWTEKIAVYLRHASHCASMPGLSAGSGGFGSNDGGWPSPAGGALAPSASNDDTRSVGWLSTNGARSGSAAGGGVIGGVIGGVGGVHGGGALSSSSAADPASAFRLRLLASMRRRLRRYGVLPVPRLRRLLWPFFAGLLAAPNRPPPSLYTQLALSDVPSDVEDVILRDLGRTLPTHAMFVGSDSAGQVALHRLLRAYCALDPEVGYCQGMGFIAAILLLHLPEDDAFWVFVQLLHGKLFRMRLLFVTGFPLLQKFFVVMRRLTRQLLPCLAAHFEEQGVDVSFFAAQWFMTIFAYQFPVPLVCSIWDLFFSGGWKMVFRVAFALLHWEQPGLLGMRMEDILLRLKSIHEGKDHAELLRRALDVPVREEDLSVDESDDVAS